MEVHWLRVGHCRHPEWVTLRGGRWQPVDFPAHCALIIHPSVGPILYDTGYADHFAAETRTLPNALYRWVTPVQLPAEQQLRSQLRARGVRMEDVARVLVMIVVHDSASACGATSSGGRRDHRCRSEPAGAHPSAGSRPIRAG